MDIFVVDLVLAVTHAVAIDIVAAAAAQGISASAATQRVVSGFFIDVAAFTARAAQKVITVAALEAVIAVATVERIVAHTAIDGVVAIFAKEVVAPLVAENAIIARTGIHGVGTGAAID